MRLTTLVCVPYPATRLRRLRRTPVLRDLVRETHLGPEHLVLPLFVEAGLDGRKPIEAMPGVERLSIDALVEEAGAARAAGVPAVLLFGIPGAKDPEGKGYLLFSDIPNNVVHKWQNGKLSEHVKPSGYTGKAPDLTVKLLSGVYDIPAGFIFAECSANRFSSRVCFSRNCASRVLDAVMSANVITTPSMRSSSVR